MTFLNPAIFAGLLALGLPIAIHLLSQPRLRRIHWAANQFLLAQVPKNQRRRQVDDWLLLLLRCLLIALLVSIFARPAMLTDKPADSALTDATTTVILLDNSASMGQSDGWQTRFDQAKARANEIVAGLPPGSGVALYLVSDRAHALLARPTVDFDLFRRTLVQATVSDGGSNLYPGLQAALQALKSAPTPRRQVFILTDSQVAAWRDLASLQKLQKENPAITLQAVVIGHQGEDNVAISHLQITGALAAVHQALPCSIEVTNWSLKAVENIAVKLAADGESPQDETTIDRLEPGASREVKLTAHFATPGYHSLTATIPADRLAVDNQRTSALLVLDQIPVLIIEGTTNAEPTARDGFFLSHALVPVPREQAAQHYVKVTLGQPDDLTRSALDHYPIVFLSNVGRLTPTAAQRLRDYVNHGGALVIFPGPNTDLDNTNNDPDFSPLLPAQLQPAQEISSQQKFLSWQSNAYTHPVTALWNEPASGHLGGVHVFKYFPLVLRSTAANTGESVAQIVVRYTNGEPAVVEQTVGQGKVFLFSHTATTAWSTLPLHPGFVPLLLRIVTYATRKIGSGLNVPAGRAFVFPVDPAYLGQTVSVLRPGDTARQEIGQVEGDSTAATLHFSETDRAGAYQIFIGNSSIPKVIFAVQIDPIEANLHQEPAAPLATFLQPPKPADVVNTPFANPASTDHHLVPGREYGCWIAAIALLFSMMELALAGRFRRSK